MSNPSSRVRLIFIRHAQSEANLVFSIICGQNIPSTLTPLGTEQAILLGRLFKSFYRYNRFVLSIRQTF